MKKNSLYIAGICAALSVGALGCASSAKAGDEETKPVVEDTEAAGEATAAETICVYGPVSEVTSDSVTIDNQSGISSAGEMVITFSPETPIFDAETGNPVAVPVYTEIESVKKSAENDDTVCVKAKDGVTYTVSAETRILPYLTRNIVTADDLEAGKKCAIWADAEGKVSRLVLFQQ